MQLNLELILIIGTSFFGLVLLYYYFIVGKVSRTEGQLDPILLDYAKSFFPIFLLIIVLRSFIAEPFRIPSGSMIPTLEVGDFILVKKYSYALRLPILNTKIMDVGEPKRGDVVVFRYPKSPQVYYIKRVIGLPGDHIEWTAKKRLIINAKPVVVISDDDYQYKDNSGNTLFAKQGVELLTKSNPHQLITFSTPTQAGKWTVPEGHYFMMGDNRDKSSDSRSWGFVPKSHLVGKASLVWMHWNWLDKGDGFQSSRIGVPVN